MILSVNFDKREDIEIFFRNYDFEKSTFCGVKAEVDSLTIEWEETKLYYKYGKVTICIGESFEFKNQDQESIKKVCDDISKYMDIE